MTTIIAIRCKDGVILGADTQSTGFTRDSVTKITELGENALIACAGAETYIALFKDHLRDALKRHSNKETDYFKILNEAAETYGQQITRILRNVPDDYELQNVSLEAIFAVFDRAKNSNRIFHAPLPETFTEVLPPQHRVTAGTGGLSALVFLRSAEDLMMRMDFKPEKNWTEFSRRLVSQLCFVLLRRISYLDPYSSGQQIYRIDSSSHLLSPTEIFDNVEPGDTANLTVLARTIQDEVDPQKISRILRVFRGPEVMQKFLSPAPAKKDGTPPAKARE